MAREHETILCFGTFAKVLKFCKLGHYEQEEITDCMLVGRITRTIDSGSRYINENNRSAVSRLLNCQGDFTPRYLGGGEGVNTHEPMSIIKELASDINRKEAIKREDAVKEFEKNVVPLIDNNKKAWAVLALLEIIKYDADIDNKTAASFYEYANMNKVDMLQEDEFVLAEFFTDILLYTLNATKNTDVKGTDKRKKCSKMIDEKYMEGFVNKQKPVIYNSIPEQMHSLFEHYIQDCRIKDYIDNDPNVFLSRDLEGEVERFIEIIESKIIKGFDDYQSRLMYEKIGEFYQKLCAYNHYLSCMMRSASSDSNCFVPIWRSENPRWAFDFRETTDEYRKQIVSLYEQICDNNTLYG